MKPQFPNVIDHIRSATWGDNPELQSERERAIQVLNGRPGIDEKYEKLIFKLDRYLSGLVDQKAELERRVEESHFPAQAHHNKGRLKMLNRCIQEAQWMRARNADLIAHIKKQP